jgi:site-specific DNA-methyltransferase (adenine-specific)
LWEQYSRVIKDNGAIVLFANQPFTTKLIASNYKMFKYIWTWNKKQGANFITSHYQPLRITEDVCVFGKYACSYNREDKVMKYNPQFSRGKPYKCVSGKQKQASIIREGKKGWQDIQGTLTVSNGERFPTNVLEFPKDKDKLHPTQKPVALLEYLIKTYTNEGDTVLDNCMGSGSTGVACVKTGRRFIGMELDEKYVEVAKQRINDAVFSFA